MLVRPALPPRILGRRRVLSGLAALLLNLTPVLALGPPAEPAPRLRPESIGLVEAPRYPDQFLRACVRSDLSGRAKLVYAVLLSHWSHLRGDAWPSLTTIAAEASLCKDTVIAAIYELEENGWVRVRRRMRRSERAANEPSSNLYRFDVDFGCELEALAGEHASAERAAEERAAEERAAGRAAMAELAQVREELARLRVLVAGASTAAASSATSPAAASSASSSPVLTAAAAGLEGPAGRIFDELASRAELRVLAVADFARLLWSKAQDRGRSLAGALEALAELAEKHRARIALRRARVWTLEELADRALAFVGRAREVEDAPAPLVAAARNPRTEEFAWGWEEQPAAQPPREWFSNVARLLGEPSSASSAPVRPLLTGPPRPT